MKIDIKTYSSYDEAKKAFIDDLEVHRDLIVKAFNTYGQDLCAKYNVSQDDMYQRVHNHDLSKYQEDEMNGIIDFFYRYPIEGLDLDCPRRRVLYKRAIMNHYTRNDHHPEHWVRAAANTHHMLECNAMSMPAIIEMILEWVATGAQVGRDSATDHWIVARTSHVFHEDTITTVDNMIDFINTCGVIRLT